MNYSGGEYYNSDYEGGSENTMCCVCICLFVVLLFYVFKNNSNEGFKHKIHQAQGMGRSHVNNIRESHKGHQHIPPSVLQLQEFSHTK